MTSGEIYQMSLLSVLANVASAGPVQSPQEGIGIRLMILPLGRVHLAGHGAHHRPARILRQIPCVLHDPTPVQSIPDTGPVSSWMVAHLLHIGRS